MPMNYVYNVPTKPVDVSGQHFVGLVLMTATVSDSFQTVAELNTGIYKAGWGGIVDVVAWLPGAYPGQAFQYMEYITLLGGGTAHYRNNVWAAGPMPFSGELVTNNPDWRFVTTVSMNNVDSDGTDNTAALDTVGAGSIITVNAGTTAWAFHVTAALAPSGWVGTSIAMRGFTVDAGTKTEGDIATPGQTVVIDVTARIAGTGVDSHTNLAGIAPPPAEGDLAFVRDELSTTDPNVGRYRYSTFVGPNGPTGMWLGLTNQIHNVASNDERDALTAAVGDLAVVAATGSVSQLTATGWNVILDSFVTTGDRDPRFADGEMKFILSADGLPDLELTCETGYVVQEYDLGYPDVRPVVYDVALDNGTFDLTRFFGARVFTLNIALRPTGTADGTGPIITPEPQLRDRLLAYLVPNRRPLLTFQEWEDDRVRTMRLRAEAAALAVSQPRFNKLSVSWVVPSGLILGIAPWRFAWEIDKNSQPAVREMHNVGTVDAHWKARISGASYHPTFWLNKGTPNEQAIQLNYALGKSDVVEIDSFTRRITVNGVPTAYQYIGNHADWWRVPVGVSELTVTTNGIVNSGDTPGDWNSLPPMIPTPNPDTDASWEPTPTIKANLWVWSAGTTPGIDGASEALIDFSFYPTWI